MMDTSVATTKKLTWRRFLLEILPIFVSDFIICGFVGWLYETVITSIYFAEFADRGVLPIPILPIYGLFSLILPFFYRKHKNPIFVLLTSSIAATVFELAGAYLTEAIWHERLWDYSHWKFNYFDGRISLFSSLIFGALCVCFVKGFHPFSLFLQRKLGKGFVIGLAVLSAILVILCFVLEKKGN